MAMCRSWDAADTVVERDGEIPVTVVSLFELLKSQGVSDDALNLLESLLREDAAKANVYDGIRRSVIDKMGLRDRPLLDQYQDQIFRLPLGTRLAIMGPPGSGKTTTLVKRLGQKLDLEYLDEDEHKTVRGTTAGEKGHAKSWLMFTPNELLRLYVREAFAREDVPASDLHIQTWVDYRRELGRQRLGILRTTTGSGGIMREGLQSLQESTISDTIRWYEDFQTWQAAAFWDELSTHAQRLSENTDGRVRRLGTQFKRVVEEEIFGSRISSLNKVLNRSGAVTELAAELRKAIDDRLGQAFSAQLLKNNELLDDLASFQASLGDANESLDDLDDLEGDDEEEEERQPQGSNRQVAFDAYKRAARAQARAAVVGRAVGRRTRNGRILEWLGDRSLSELDRQEIGSLLRVVDSLRRLSNPVGHYLNRIPQRYRRFRRQRQTEKLWYRPQARRTERCALTAIGIDYWAHLPCLFAWPAGRDHDPCPFGAVYQLARNALAAVVTPDGDVVPDRGHVLVLYDARNPAFQPGGQADTQWEAAVTACLVPGLLRRLSWQRLLKVMDAARDLSWLLDALGNKYGLVPASG
jgi:hypothetical protein